jgi:hypothetical protein
MKLLQHIGFLMGTKNKDDRNEQLKTIAITGDVK